jgi:hypothetical protein
MKQMWYKDTPIDYRVGDWVTFNTVCEMRSVEEKVVGTEKLAILRKAMPKSLPQVRVGQVVGVAIRFEGTLCESVRYSYIDGSIDDSRPYLTIDKSVVLYEVRTGLSNKPFLVWPCDTHPAPTHPARLPLRSNSLTEEGRAVLSKIMKEIVHEFPRDEKGRFI